jgi:WD40 repeat protein
VFARLAVGLALVGFLSVPASAQQFDRRARDEPEVHIEAGGRTGTCDVLRFTPDGRFLLAAGDDKVVRVWPYSATGLDTAPGKARTLHWRSWRDQLGGIKAVATTPDGKLVAVGGYGLRVSTVAIIDREAGQSGRTAAITWPRPNVGGSNFDAVMAVAFHPDGKRVGFGTADGSLWLWDPVKLATPEADGRAWSAPVRAGRFEVQKSATGEEQFNYPRSIHFPDASTLVAVANSGQVLACDLTRMMSDDPAVPPPPGKTLFNINAVLPPGKKYPVDQAHWTADGRWLVVATKGPLVLLRSSDGRRTVRLDLPADHFPRSVAVDSRTGRVAVGVAAARLGVSGKPRFYMEGNDEIWVYDDPTAGKPDDPKKLPHPGRAEALAFHPTDDRLTVAGGDADEITLLDLAKPEKPVSVVRSAGRRLWAVNLSDDGDVIGVRTGRNPNATHPNHRADGPWLQFDLPRFTYTADTSIKWADPVSSAGGWEIVPDTDSRFVWWAERPHAGGGKDRLRLGLDRDQDQVPTCFTFVPTADGKPARVLVGHYYGCSLFELDPARVLRNPRTGVEELPRSKLFIGHGAEVTSVVADKKGTWFVTAGADQTVAGWSLADWNSQPALGAAFEVKDGQLATTTVDIGSPAWEAGLSKGDVIDLLAVDGKLTFDRRPGKPVVGTAGVAAAALRNPQSGIELFFGWSANGERRATPTRLKQRPLWKWFPAFDGQGRLTDSVMWMWHGSYYFTASVHGDRMVGWHVNPPDVAGTPDFQSLERYKELFLKPDVIAKLVATRSVADALKLALGDNPRAQSFQEVKAREVDLTLGQAVVRPEGVNVSVSVNPLGSNPDLLPFRVELWLNDYRYKVWAGKGKDGIADEIVIPASAFRAGDNQITLLAINPAHGRSETIRYVSNPNPPGKPALFGLAVGINDYSGHRKAVTGERAFGDLRRAHADATEFTRRLHEYLGPDEQFSGDGLVNLLDAAAGRNALAGTLDDLLKKQAAGKIKPDDLLVVFFAGHGDLLSADGKASLQPSRDGRGFAADEGMFVFCCPDYAPAKVGTTALSGEALFDALARINCRKLVLLDSCHAGGAVETNLLRRVIPNGQGPLVIAACSQGQKSFEDDKLGHGVFTYAVLEALGPKFRAADANSDGSLSPAELFDYVTRRVPELLRGLRPGSTQNPICFPQPGALPRTPLVAR